MADRKGADDLLIHFLASGLSMVKAARKCKVSTRTVQRRLKDHDFQRRVLTARGQLVGRVAGQLAALGPAAVGALRALLAEGKPDAIRAGAARTVLRQLFGSQDLVTLTQYCNELQWWVEETKEAQKRAEQEQIMSRLTTLPPAPPEDPAADRPWTVSTGEAWESFGFDGRTVPPAAEAKPAAPPAAEPEAESEEEETPSNPWGSAWETNEPQRGV